MPRIDPGIGESGEVRPGIAWLPLLVGIALLAVMTVMPSVAARHNGEADHIAALLIFWAMSAGFVRGVGYVPVHRLPRLLLSGPACLAALAFAAMRVGGAAGLQLPNGLF